MFSDTLGVYVGHPGAAPASHPREPDRLLDGHVVQEFTVPERKEILYGFSIPTELLNFPE